MLEKSAQKSKGKSHGAGSSDPAPADKTAPSMNTWRARFCYAIKTIAGRDCSAPIAVAPCQLWFYQYHRLTRANTPASVSFRRFLPFSSWRAPARLRLKSQKSLVNSSLAGALQFCRSRNVPRQGKTRREYCRIVKGLDAVWGHFCPSKPCLPLLIDGNITSANRNVNR